MDRVKRAKAMRSPVDRSGQYHERIAEFARARGIDVCDAVDQWSERAAAREYAAGYSRDEAEKLAYEDLLEMYKL